MIFYTCDPSTRATGIAQFFNGELYSAICIEAQDVDEMLANVAAHFTLHPPALFDELLIEAPGFYKFDKANPKNIAKIHQIVGAVRLHFTTSRTITPAKWNHSRPKEITHGRMRYPLLSRKELAILDSVRAAVRDNVYDAAGIGLWALGRMV